MTIVIKGIKASEDDNCHQASSIANHCHWHTDHRRALSQNERMCCQQISFMKSAFVSLLHNHAGKSLMQSSHNIYQPLSLEGPMLNCQIAREGFWAKVFLPKVWPGGAKCGTVGRSVVDSLPGEEGKSRGSRHDWL